MARIGKCRKCNKDWVTLGSYANSERGCDGIGFCRRCMTEHRLEMKGSSRNYTIMEDWELRSLDQ